MSKRIVLIVGAIAALGVAGWYFFIKRAQPAANTPTKSTGLSLASFDPTSKSAPYGSLTRQGIQILKDKLNW